MDGEILSIETAKKIADLEQRIDKAIEYIKTVPVDFSYRDRPEYIEYAITEYNDKLLNILEGELK